MAMTSQTVEAAGLRGCPYTPAFYRQAQDGARRSARVIVPLVLDFVRPSSVIDIGCGLGTWLSVFREHGLDDVWGADGEHVDRRMLEIDEERFMALDLEQPFSVSRRFDLVLSLEVAEHLAGRSAGPFVTSLTALAPIVLFSAAAPFQGGTHHVNEQWPDYWSAHFRNRDYVPVDCLRRRIWSNENVDWWYAQNCLIFVSRGRLDDHPALLREYEVQGTSQLSIVHPKGYLQWVKWSLGARGSA
jgi:SAM-dependent methyltransferase